MIKGIVWYSIIITVIIVGSLAEAAAVTIKVWGSIPSSIAEKLENSAMQRLANIKLKMHTPERNYTIYEIANLMVKGDYDLFILPGLETFVKMGAIKPIDRYISRDNVSLKAFTGGIINMMHINARLYDLPLALRIPLMEYNIQIFEDSGIEHPELGWSWEDFRYKASVLTATKRDDQFYGAVADDELWGLMLAQTGRPTFTVDERLLSYTLEILYNMLNIEKSLYIDWLDPLKSTAWDYYRFIRNGRTAMQIVWSLQACDQCRVGITALPKLSKEAQYTLANVLSIGMSINTKHPDESWEVMKLLVEPSATIMFAANGWLPATVSPDGFHVWASVVTRQQPILGIQDLVYIRLIPRNRNMANEESKFSIQGLRRILRLLARNEITMEKALNEILHVKANVVGGRHN